MVFFKKSIAFKVPNALTTEINKEKEFILRTYNDFYYKGKMETLLLLAEPIDLTSVYTVLSIFLI